MSTLFPSIWNLIDNFKERCRLQGWETCETEDWVKTEDGEYHNFLWTQSIHPSTFERIALNHKCGIRRGNSYEVVDIFCTGWLFQESPPKLLISWLKENLELSRRTAIFDLSTIYAGENICYKYNRTESIVFREFERFLEEEWGIKFKHPNKLMTPTV